GETFDGELSGHLTAEQTAAYVDKNLSGESLQVVKDHLASCEQCVLAVADLRAFRNEIAPSLDREYRPVSVVPATTESWWRRLSFRLSPVPALGGAVLALLVLAFVAWIVWRKPKEQEPQIAAAPSPVVQPSPSSLPAAVTPEPVNVIAQLNDG